MTILSPAAIKQTLIQDGQAAASINPARFRQIVDSLAGIAATTQSASYTFGPDDAGTVIEINSASPTNVTVPPHVSVAFDQHAVLEVYQQGGGQVTLVPGAGVTFRSASGTLTLRTQYSAATLRQRTTDEWVISGDMT